MKDNTEVPARLRRTARLVAPLLANIAIVAAGAVTASIWRSALPDLIVGVGIAVMNADAAREVWTAARQEHRASAA